MAGFEFKRNRFGLSTVPSESGLIGNSATLTIGDVVDVVGGIVTLAAAGNPMYGVVIGFESQKKQVLENSVSGVDYDGTYTAGGLGVGTYAATSDNQTDKKVRAIIRPFTPGDIWSAEADGTIGTTSTSDEAGGYFDIPAASDQLDEDTFSQTTVSQFFTHGPDSSKGGNWLLVEAREVQV